MSHDPVTLRASSTELDAASVLSIGAQRDHAQAQTPQRSFPVQSQPHSLVTIHDIPSASEGSLLVNSEVVRPGSRGITKPRLHPAADAGAGGAGGGESAEGSGEVAGIGGASADMNNKPSLERMRGRSRSSGRCGSPWEPVKTDCSQSVLENAADSTAEGRRKARKIDREDGSSMRLEVFDGDNNGAVKVGDKGRS